MVIGEGGDKVARSNDQARRGAPDGGGRAKDVRVGVADAKARLAELLDRAEQGEASIVTRHGRPVAMIGPYVDDAAEMRAHRGRVIAAFEVLAMQGPIVPTSDIIATVADVVA